MKDFFFLIALNLLLIPLPVLGDDSIQDCPIWRTRLPWENAGKWLCDSSKTKILAKDDASMMVILNQAEETSWRNHSHKDQVIAEIEDGIKASLDLFGNHAGTPQSPLKIHATISNVARKPPTTIGLVEFDSQGAEGPDGIASPCYLRISFPTKDLERPSTLVKLKKEIVQNMYHCVEQYHHPHLRVHESIDQPGHLWWWHSIAMFFGGLAWPAAPDMMDDPFRWGVNLYPENFDGWLPIAWGGQSSALFWHFAHNTGWSPSKITDWMKARNVTNGEYTENAEAAFLAHDPELKRLVHGFARALADGNVSYPSGPINLTAVTSHNYEWHLLRLMRVNEVWHEEGNLNCWEATQKVNIHVAPGQTLNVSISHRGYMSLQADLRFKEILIAPEDEYWLADLEWSYRKAGTREWTTAQAGQTERIVVPAVGDNAGGQMYEILPTCTGIVWTHLELNITLKRVE